MHVPHFYSYLRNPPTVPPVGLSEGTIRHGDLEWTIRPSVSPAGAIIAFDLTGQHTRGYFHILPHEAEAIGHGLLTAARWARHKERA